MLALSSIGQDTNKLQVGGEQKKTYLTMDQFIPPGKREPWLEIHFLEEEPELRKLAWCRKKKLPSGLGVRKPKLCFCGSLAVGLEQVTSSAHPIFLTGKKGKLV